MERPLGDGPIGGNGAMVPATTGLVVPFTGHEEVDETLTENQAGLIPTPMVVDQQIFYQPV